MKFILTCVLIFAFTLCARAAESPLANVIDSGEMGDVAGEDKSSERLANLQKVEEAGLYDYFKVAICMVYIGIAFMH